MKSILKLAALSIILISLPSKAQDRMADMAASFSNEPAQNSFEVNLWDGDYEKTICEFVFGYVNKSWVCSYDSGTRREDFFGDPDDKYLHGFQFGALFTPSFDWGLGLRTGLCMEVYQSHSKWITNWCHHFSETDLYIPLHASFRIPFTQDFGINFYGGMGFQWAIDGKYYNQVGTVWRWWRRPVPVYVGEKHVYGNGWPKKVNWQAECGLNLRFSNFAIGFTYSFGIVDHGIQDTFDGGLTFITANRSRQDKMQATFIVTF